MTTFASLPLHSALARALTARGYETATPVQAAVLDPLHTGRDLTVSSQTGSGKTIAFGALLAQTLLTEGTPWTRGTRPAALVIVPTRELAQQVREELGWFLQ
ncbi:MAG TPA: DEAD/DEAH box helicase, partial [Polyangia bacterium]|nr:DEAD/DEAH box helicase [Polyangia bacterium]